MSNPPRSKPLLVYDGDCTFCRLWIERWKAFTGDRIDYAPFQDVADAFPRISPEQFKKSVQLLMPDGSVFSAAHAVLQTLRHASGKRWVLWLYEHGPGVAPLTELAYRFVSTHRNGLYSFTRLLWGDNLQPPSYRLTRCLFFRGIGIIYFIAFLSLSSQVVGLVGSNGILPTYQFLDAVREELGSDAYRLFPTLAWLAADDGFLRFLCIGGMVFSVALVFGILPRIVSALAWIFYLSLYTVGQDFLSFQWDILLLEAGFLTIFFAPLQFLPSISRERAASRTILWLIRFLLFRLVFQSGVVKLTSGDPNWLDLTALTFHFETQCIPTPLAWYAHQLPVWFQKLSVIMMFAAEIVIPVTIFAPRRLRMLGAWLIIGFQLSIILTGNYTFFNWLTIVLCVTLFDDAALRRIFPKRFLGEKMNGNVVHSGQIKGILLAAFASVMIILNLTHLAGLFMRLHALPRPLTALMQWTQPYAIVNSYGLFRVMTTSRPEIIVEGSNDGKSWSAYEFKYKPGDLNRAPPWVAPHQPRLDWQMWFAALGNYQSNPWFVNFMVRLLQGSPDVLALLEYNPLPGAPPRYVRALLYDYRFTDFTQRRATGAHWRREYQEVYLPPISLREN